MLIIEKILCPTDFSPPSYAALKSASELALQFNAELCALHVLEPLEPVLGIISKAEFDASRTSDAAHEIHRMMRECVDGKVRTRSIIKIGSAPSEILLTLMEEIPDLIVIATHGLSGWRHMIFGSVAEEIIRLSQYSVLTVHAPQPALAETPSFMA